MTTQLLLIDTDAPTWKIPETTREIGRRGLAEARAVLHSIPRRTPADDVDGPAALPTPGVLGDAAPAHPAAA